MLVETYEVEETSSEAGTLAADSEAADLIAKLELSGQQKLLNPETVTRFPYRKMTKDEALVYHIICPIVTALTDYEDGLIPIRVLQVAAHAKELDFCNRLVIWHPESADIKDPFLVGIKGPEYENRQVFLLARWGEELPSFEQLREKALKIWRRKRLSALSQIKAEVEGLIASIETASGLTQGPTFYADL